MSVLIPVVVVVILLSGGAKKDRKVRLARPSRAVAVASARVAVPAPAARVQPEAVAAKHAFEALRDNDYERMAPVVPTLADMEFLMAAMRKASPEKADQLAGMFEARGGLEAAVTKMRERSRKRFQQFREKSLEDLDWTAARFTGLDKEHSRTWQEDGCDFMDIAFSVGSGDREETFLLSRCARTPRGWVTGGAIGHATAEVAARVPSQDTLDGQRARAQMAILGAALRMYHLKNGELPESIDALGEADPKTGEEAYVEEVPADPWGNAFLLRRLGGARFQIASAGPDGKIGTPDDIAWP